VWELKDGRLRTADFVKLQIEAEISH